MVIPNPNNWGSCCKSRAKTVGLQKNTIGEVAPGNTGRETWIILDLRTGAGLAAGSVTFHDGGIQSFRTGTHRSGKAGRTGADNYQVKSMACDIQAAPKSHRRANLAQTGTPQQPIVSADDDRWQIPRLILRKIEMPQHRVALFTIDVDESVRDVVFVQEIADQKSFWIL